MKVSLINISLELRGIIEKSLSYHLPQLTIVSQTEGVLSSVYAINKHDPDLVIVDLDLKDRSAFGIIKGTAWKDYKMIFIVSYQNPFLNDIQLSGVNYIYKPFDIEELIGCIDKIINNNKYNNLKRSKIFKALLYNARKNQNEKCIVFKTDNSVRVAPVSDLICGKSDFSKSKMYFLEKKSITVHEPLRRFENILSGYDFFRCHSIYVVNYNRIKNIKYNISYLEMENGMLIPFEINRLEKFINQRTTISKISNINDSLLTSK